MIGREIGGLVLYFLKCYLKSQDIVSYDNLARISMIKMGLDEKKK